jgi:FkbM family methyltransferase
MKNRLINKSYSQGGEDLVLAKLLKYKSNGFYIDVGANDPIALNNTYFFYKMGWRGINFEPIPELAKNFKNKRNEDIVIDKAMSNFVGETEFCLGIDEYNVNSSLLNMDLPKQNFIKVSVDKLENVLNELNINKIDFSSIDTEGTEIDVLEGLNLDKYRPQFILAEYNPAAKANDKLQPYLLTKGYQPVFINSWNIIFSQDFSKDAIICYKNVSFIEKFKYLAKRILKKKLRMIITLAFTIYNKENWIESI